MVKPSHVTRNISKQDLRSWLSEMDAAGEIRHIKGANREREIGGIVDIYQRKIGNPAVLFDDIPGYPKGYRVLANLLTSIRRINLTLGQSRHRCSEIELVQLLAPLYESRRKIYSAGQVNVGRAARERRSSGDDIDLFKDSGAEMA